MAELDELERRLTDALQRIAVAQQTSSELAVENAGQIASLLDENAALSAKLAEVEEAAAPALDAGEASAEDTSAAAEKIAALEEALEAERNERMTQAEALSEAIAERTRLMDAQDQAHAEREELVAQAQRIAEREALKMAEARGELEDLRGRIDALEASGDKLREANRQLRSNNAALRQAHMAGIADAELINSGLQAELDALAAVRAADRAELDGVLAALRPMLEEAADA